MEFFICFAALNAELGCYTERPLLALNRSASSIVAYLKADARHSDPDQNFVTFIQVYIVPAVVPFQDFIVAKRRNLLVSNPGTAVPKQTGQKRLALHRF